MKNKAQTIALLLAIVAYAISCQTAAEQEKKNIREVSELSHVMRHIVEKTKSIRADISNGEAPAEDHRGRFKQIVTAQPTNDKTKGEHFEGMANSFLASLDKIYTDPSNRSKHYKSMVQTCQNCHAIQCPGPMNLIKGLQLK